MSRSVAALVSRQHRLLLSNHPLPYLGECETHGVFFWKIHRNTTVLLVFFGVVNSSMQTQRLRQAFFKQHLGETCQGSIHLVTFVKQMVRMTALFMISFKFTTN